MYSRNKQRKEQQLLNLRQLSPKSGTQVNVDSNDQNKDNSRSSANRSPNQSPPLTSNASPNQSSKVSIVVRNSCRTPKRDTNCGNESTYGSPKVLQSITETNPNMSLRSVNRSPTVRSQTLSRTPGSVGLQSRPIHSSPNSRSNASLPQTLVSQSSTNSQNKPQVLSQISKISDNNSVKQRANESVIDNQNKQKSLSSTSTTSTTTEANISPEILFLVKEQAKAIAKINALQKKVERLEQTINCQNNSSNHLNSTHEMSSASSASTTKLVNNNSNTSKERNAISDDSGGEYSRATTTSDDDELSLLLDQIARRSQQLQTSHPLNTRFTNMSISSSISGNNNNELLPQTMQMRANRHTYPKPTPSQMSHSTRPTPRQTLFEPKIYSNYINSGAVIPSQASPATQSSLQPLPAPHHSSISALLFESNVENVLKNLDEIIANEPIDSNRFSNSSTLSQTYQRPHHSSQSLYDTIGITGAGVSSGLLQNNNSTLSHNWQHLERAKSLVKQREEREFDKQMRLNEEWLQTQLKAQEPNNKQFRRNNFIDSLEPTFR